MLLLVACVCVCGRVCVVRVCVSARVRMGVIIAFFFVCSFFYCLFFFHSFVGEITRTLRVQICI